MSHFNMVHNPTPMPEAWIFLRQRPLSTRNGQHCRSYCFWTILVARFSIIRHGDDWSIKLRATGWHRRFFKRNFILQKLKPQSKEEHEFHNQVLDSICARCGQYPTNLQYSPLNVAMWSHFTSDCLWASSWLAKDHEDFKRMAMNGSFRRTRDLI